MRSLVVGVFTVLLLVATHASAETIDPTVSFLPTRAIHNPWRISWLMSGDEPAPVFRALSLAFPSTLLQQDEPQPLHAAAVEHSDAYERRKKIHKYASFATLPLFATEVALGQSLYNTPANLGSKRTAHANRGRRHRRSFRRQYGHWRVEYVRGRPQRSRGSYAAPPARAADDGRRRRVRRDRPVRTQQPESAPGADV